MTLIIAEAGVNHNGSEELAKQLIDVAYEAGADIVKFQTFKANKLVTENAQQASYQVQNTQKKESQLDMLTRLELSYDAHHRLLAHCSSLGIEFLSTAFDEKSLNFLVKDIGVKRLKIPSGEITNAPLVLAHARTGLDIIVSTGMACLSEIEEVLGVVAFGYLGWEGEPCPESFSRAYTSEEGQAVLKKKVTILHCTTEYPAPMDEINLRAMNSIGTAFDLPVGYSDHSEGIDIPIAAVARDAKIIEKHYTLDKNMEGPDHKASLAPDELAAMVKAVRRVEAALGRSVKAPTKSETPNKLVARKSLVANRKIEVGDRFTSNNLTVKRPGGGMSPFFYWSILKTSATRSYLPGDLIDE
ncbi:N-acetylneuraminate synthase [Marinagarivorans algicola]|uniref:N-acetylneuraminate synthase n=1 Tax=Marinagarivorans algicola TaxID=1513270 RepID=UPI0006B88F6A|nr:N-acetylneuraminate synthase [Marinagarivorans algicola]